MTVYNNLGEWEVRKKNYSKAIEYFLKAEPLILVHSFSESHTKRSFYANYAYALEKVGKSKEAFEYLKKAKDNGYENMLKLHFDMNVNNPFVELWVYKTEDDSCITKYVENNDEEPAIISEIMYDLKNEVVAMIETFKFYNQNPFSGLVYTLTSNGEVSLELTYGDK